MAEDNKTTDNPGGYRPDDPRYGLSGQALLDYYLARPTQFYIRSNYKADALERREEAMAEHLAHLRSNADRIQFAGPVLADDGETPIATMSIVQADDRAAAEAFAAADGYAKHGMLEDPQIIRFISSKRLGQNDRAPDPGRQMFICECIDGPDAARLRKESAADHHAYQGSIIDRYIAHGPLRSDDGKDLIGSLFIVEVEDRAAAEDLVNNEPMTKAGVFSDVRIFRWRYGKAISP
ncbi:MAG: hypothetical protein JJ899_17160 [Alphaproteobacteria bacterium]|nr:hypothetical protein [Alphaproteobacteria bacterium]